MNYNQMISDGVSPDIRLYPQRFDQCPYCLQPFTFNIVRKLLNCGHFICASCLQQENKCFYQNCSNKNPTSKTYMIKEQMSQNIIISVNVMNRMQSRQIRVSPLITVSQLIKMLNNEYHEQLNSFQNIVIIINNKSYAYQKLQHQKSNLWQLGMKKNNHIFISQRYSGGGGVTTLFSNLQNPVHLGFSSQAPIYRIISTGLNFEGKCMNNKCKTFKNKAWCQKGFGKFIINVETKKCLCPLCGEKLKDVLNIGLYRAKATIKGMKQNEEEVKKQIQSSNWQKFLTFEDKDETRCNWIYLEMIVEEI